MGYRSTVVYVFYTRKPDKVSFPLLKLWFDENFARHANYADITTGDDHIKVTWEDIKWYTGYEEVNVVERAVALFTDTFEANEKDTVAWEMVRVGEQTDDIEHEGSSYMDWRLGVMREIIFS